MKQIILSSYGFEKNIALKQRLFELLPKLAGQNLGLSDEEVAFYDAISVVGKTALKNGELRAFVKELVSVIKRDLTVDWSDSEIIKARIRANVRLMLLRNKFPARESERLIDLIFQQAKMLYREYAPVSA